MTDRAHSGVSYSRRAPLTGFKRWRPLPAKRYNPGWCPSKPPHSLLVISRTVPDFSSHSGGRICNIYGYGVNARKKFSGTTEAALAAAAQQPHLLGCRGTRSREKAGQRGCRVSGSRPLLDYSGKGFPQPGTGSGTPRARERPAQRGGEARPGGSPWPGETRSVRILFLGTVAWGAAVPLDWRILARAQTGPRGGCVNPSPDACPLGSVTPRGFNSFRGTQKLAAEGPRIFLPVSGEDSFLKILWKWHIELSRLYPWFIYSSTFMHEAAW